VLRHFDLNGHAVSVDLLHGVPPPTIPFPRLPAGRLLVSSPEPVPLHVLRWEGCREGRAWEDCCFQYEPYAINHVLAEQEVRIEPYASLARCLQLDFVFSRSCSK
jgi:hypothetical protein